jgi:nucleotide-binding universal stress UspA family protein
MFKKLLIPIDGSPYSDKALAEGLALAKALKAKAIILHVIENPVVLYGAGDAVSYQTELYDELRKQANQLLASARKTAGQAGVEVQTLLTENARTTDAIASIQDDYDLIVMGTHGRKGMSRWLMGSVAEGVLRRATKPCLVVHSNGGNYARS